MPIPEAQNEESQPISTPSPAAPADETLETVRAQCNEYLSGWRRAQADYANLKRESDREKSEFSKYANERLLMELLPAIDQYDIALSFIPDTSTLPEADRKRFDNWLTGIRAVRGLWEGSFQAIGLEQVPTTGNFDPLIHEALGEEEKAGVEPGAIIRVAQHGWRLNGKLLRPAKVILAK